MREIKFRAYDLDYKMMIYPKAHYVEQGGIATQKQKDKEWSNYVIGEVYNPEENEYHAIVRGDTRFILLQYTGLKDKNGKEIYESDILEHSQHEYTEKFEVCYGLGNYDSGVYKFIGFYLKKISNGDDDGYTGYMFDTNYIEVIGNIWQNPELLDNQEGK